jgi:hypothetical protein
VMGDGAAPAEVSSFVRRWRARINSDSRPLNSSPNTRRAGRHRKRTFPARTKRIARLETEFLLALAHSRAEIIQQRLSLPEHRDADPLSPESRMRAPRSSRSKT